MSQSGQGLAKAGKAVTGITLNSPTRRREFAANRLDGTIGFAMVFRQLQ